MITFFCTVIGASILTIIDFIYMPFFGPGMIISPLDPDYTDMPSFVANMYFNTELPDGLYPSPGNDKNIYVAVKNGAAIVKLCEHNCQFSWYRADGVYYSSEDGLLIMN